MSRRFLLAAILLTASAGLATDALASENLQGSPSQVIALINSYRAGSGLPAYQENGILMVTAQGQADYLASTQNSSGDIHAGPGGSRPRDRAFAAGYGGGEQIFISEIAKYGLNETPEGAVGWWKTSQIHNDTMLASTYVEIGCGVATDGNNRYYYVCLTGYIAGGAYTPSSGTSSSSSQSAQPAAPVMIPVTKAEPQSDGSIVHIIRTGQTLWTLAAVYEVPLQQILDLNGFGESQVVHPNDEVIIAPAGAYATTEPTADPNASPEPSATPTEAPTATATQQLAVAEADPADAQPAAAENAAPANAEQENSSVQLVVGIALVSILGVIVASFFIQRPQPEPETNDNDPFAPIT
jgi:uncharacterized protein YkwD